MIVGLHSGRNLCLGGYGFLCQVHPEAGYYVVGREGLRSRCASGHVQIPSAPFLPAILWFFRAR
ncbi:hypothetical protein CcI6DRAFT_03794 [Frankia sp. CcI6]|nr:hypothetical protein CcI6DRAFT_03794 [Frankia sp. CcI6]KFB03337.1 hypothetical protein ALLO2DRAFT_03932 [Frankia sp. Allo2]OAA21327.1 hypothetical protein AAY23_107930 [Frankia casuarinae]OFB43822.1 hypothetical protein Manayef4_10430 [Frankia sp. CgIM4]